MQQRVVLHLGVHKTATTYIQSRLEENLEQLNAAGIAYLPLQAFRDQITRHLNDDAFDRHKVADILTHYANAESIILSDENILGSAKPHAGLLYSGYLPRVRKVVNACYGKKLEVHITIRNYHDFLISRYSETLRHRPFISFERYTDKLELAEVSWLHLLEELLSLDFIQRIHVTLFEELFHHEQSYFDTLLGKPLALLPLTQNKQAIKRSKISAQSYDILQSVNQHYGARVTKEVMNLIDVKEQITDITPLSPLTADLKEMLDEKYLTDIEKIKQHFADRVIINH